MASNPADRSPTPMPGASPPMPAVARILSRHDRDKLSAFITVAIDLLDVLDGDADLEDSDEDRCEAGDDGCGPHLHYGIHWGASDDEGYTEVAYGIDQTKGPLGPR